MDAASTGDTVLVAPGTYRENINFAGKGILVTSGATAYTNAGPVVLEGIATGPTVTLHSGEPASATLNGFVITHGSDGNGTQYAGNGIDLAGSSGTFTNNIIQGNAGCALAAFKAPTLSFQGNQLTGQHDSVLYGPNFDCDFMTFAANPQLSLAGVGYPAVFVFWSGNVTISDNLIENNESFGLNGIIDDYTETTVIRNNIVRNNSFARRSGIIVAEPRNISVIQNQVYGNSTFSRPGSGAYGIAEARSEIEIYQTLQTDGPVHYSPTFATVLNNTVFHNIILDVADGTPQDFPEAFSLFGMFAGTVVANNIFVTSQHTFPPVGCPEPISTNTISFRNNDTFGGISSTYPCSTTPSDAGNLSVDPQFVSPATFDLHTLASSPVVAAGDITVSPLPPADFDGKARTVCGTIDMGAYEVRPHPLIGLSSSPNPSAGGSLVSFPVHVAGNCNIPTGTVNLLDGQQIAGSAVLDASGNAVITTAALFVGTHSITASYPGDFNFDASTSNVVQQTVTGFPSATSLQVAPNPANAFQVIRLSASVTSQFGTPGGSITFFAGTTALATAPLSGGSAGTTVSTLGVGTYNISAVYNASTTFAGSTSPTVVEIVVGAPTTTVLGAAPNQSAFGQSVVFSATVTAPQSTAIPGGPVTFREGSNVLGTSSLVANGVATLSTSTLSVGPHAIVADYGGSSNANPSTSAPVTQVVLPVTTTVSLTGTPNPAALGGLVTLIASVSPLGNASVPSGTVTFSDQFGQIGSANLNNDRAVLTLSTLSTGTHQIVATFSPTGNFAGSVSAALAEVIQSFDFSLALSPASISLADGKQGQVNLRIVGIGNLPGNITLSAGPLPSYVTLTFTPTAVQFAAGGSGASVLTLDTVQLPRHALLDRRSKGLSFTLAGLLAMPLLFRKRRRRSFATLASLLVLSGCTNIYYTLNQVPPGTYTIPLSAMDANTRIVHTADLVLTVTP